MDAITKAINVANSPQGTSAKTQGTVDAINNAVTSASEKTDALSSDVRNLNNSLPTDKDPELIKREAEAEILEKEAIAKELLMIAREKAIDEIKAKLKSLALPSIPLPPKIPLLDPKILSAVAIAKQIKELSKERKNLAKKYLSKGRELYSYPTTQYDVNLPTKPSVLSSPKPPIAPQLPTKSNPTSNT